MAVTLFGMMTEVSLENANAACPMLVTPLGIV